MPLSQIESALWESVQEKNLDTAMVRGASVDIKGLAGSMKTLFLSLVSARLGPVILAVFPDREEAEWAAEEMDVLLGGDQSAFFPGGEGEDSDKVQLNPRRTGMRMEVLRDLVLTRLKFVSTTADGAMQKLPPPASLEQALVRLSGGAERNLSGLVGSLVDFGYVRESMVGAPGEFSLRGGILDVFPLTGEPPHRIEFFGDRIESIRTFDVATQLSYASAGDLVLVPAPSIEKEPTASLFHYLPEKSLVFLEDPEWMMAQIEKERQKERKGIWDPETFESLLRPFPVCRYHTLTGGSNCADLGGRSPFKPGPHVPDIRRGLSSLTAKNEPVWILCENESQKKRLSDVLQLADDPIPDVRLVIGPLKRGFSLPEPAGHVLTESDLFGRIFRKRKKERFRDGIPIRELSSLQPGDFVVHVDHGIGKYLGLEKIRVHDTERECLAVLYLEGDKLYVPVEKMERVQKYRGREGLDPVLSKLGGGQWERLKARTKESVKAVARELIALYSSRQTLPGHSFPPDSTWQKELEASFPYEETADQATAIDDVRQDMEKPRPMDRLVCGDVGYGKTEVAVRAAFKCVTDGKQAAVLVPTTILAQQHYRTFRERLGRFPVSVEMLSRFRSPKEQKHIVEKAKTGKIDVLIGTHRLISRDVGFRNLGLLVIDEEQRFGVRHKEKLKTLRQSVDVLTLSATPIPRTLYFSLMGIRDMSLINTPPKDRRPIITEVLPFSEDVIVEAIRRETSRGGQVFFVHNRIHSIFAVADMIKRLVPGLAVAVAHGRMEAHELERVMLDFDRGLYQCLVSTTIIESGLDLPNVNTLLINRADQMGLAQLYQLRGRVGRSDHQAYAYLFTPPFELLSPESVKRLRTIEEFTELGSGFQIAQRDLEIRGAGNLLGVEQSGNMDALGYDLYMKLVEEAVREIREEKGEEPVEPAGVDCQVDVDEPAFLPETYVDDESLRVNLYRRLAVLRAPQEVDAFESELKDRFGPMPAEARNLLESARLRLEGAARGFRKVALERNHLRLIFDDTWSGRFPDPEQFSKRIRLIVDSMPPPVRFLQKGGFGMIIPLEGLDPFLEAKNILQRVE
jgi:transcription-repair coupling factor (superfamily II helicase)